MTELTDEEAKAGANIAVSAAEKTARKFGFEIGSTVAHRNDPYAYRLLAYLKDELLVERPLDPKEPNGEKIVTTLPLLGSFDPNMARRGGRIVGEVLRARKKMKKII